VNVSVFSTTIAELKQIGFGESFVLVDAGFFSEENIKQMHREKAER